MKTKICIAAILCAVVILVGSAKVMAENDDTTIAQEKTAIQLEVNNRPVSLSQEPVLMYAGADDGLYVPFLSFAEAIGAEGIRWDASSQTATAVYSSYVVSATSENTYVQANGRYLYAKNGIHSSGEDIMAPLSVIARAFNATYVCDWDNSRIRVVPGSGTLESGDDYYDTEDVFWLARIIYAEVGGENFASKIAVGNVVMNRVASPSFPNTIHSVIFDTDGGIQFDPAANGSIYNKPSEDCYIAAKLALEGANPVKDCLFFAAVRGCWATYNRTFFTTIGSTDFYL